MLILFCTHFMREDVIVSQHSPGIPGDFYENREMIRVEWAGEVTTLQTSRLHSAETPPDFRLMTAMNDMP